MAKTSSPRRTTSTASPPVCPPTCPRSWPPSARSARGIPCARSGPESCCSSLIVGPLLFDDTPILNLADLDLATRPAKGSYNPPRLSGRGGLMLTPGVCASRVHRQGEIRPLPCLLSRSPPALTPGPESHPLSNNRPILRARMRKDLAMSDRSKRMAWTALLLAALLPLVVSLPAAAQLQWSSKDNKQSLKFGILGQMQAESADVAGSKDTSQNLFFRRLRLILGFSLSDQLSIFFDTDGPNLGKATNGVKDTGTIFVQDFVATYKFAKELQLDGGLLLMEQDYNHNQSAASLMTLDYGAYTFNESTPTTSRTGRDYGLRARGYVADDHLEYRLGVYQGVRGTNNSNDFRYAGRLMYTFFTPQVGIFYRGTSLGKTQSLS